VTVDRSGVCACGHPYAAHEHLERVTFEESDVTVHEVHDDGTVGPPIGGFAECWICNGGRLVADPTPATTPWGVVCGCGHPQLPPTFAPYKRGADPPAQRPAAPEVDDPRVVV
jgi:hypothetical protein